MARVGVAEAKNDLSGLIERALSGEHIQITRHGRPVVELTPLARQTAKDPAHALLSLKKRTAHLPRLNVPTERFYEWLYDEEEA